MRKLAVILGVVVLVAGAGLVGWRLYSGPAAPEAQVALGGKVAAFTLPDVNGKSYSLADLRGAKGTLLIFISTRCPYSNAYNERMEAVNRDYSAKGIRVVGINSNKTEPEEDVRAHAAQSKLTFTILKDEDNRVADYFGASVTPEVYLLDSDDVLRYHGRLDASHEDPSLNAGELRDALDAHLRSQAIAAGKKAFGCTIKRVG